MLAPPPNELSFFISLHEDYIYIQWVGNWVWSSEKFGLLLAYNHPCLGPGHLLEGLDVAILHAH